MKQKSEKLYDKRPNDTLHLDTHPTHHPTQQTFKNEKKKTKNRTKTSPPPAGAPEHVQPTRNKVPLDMHIERFVQMRHNIPNCAQRNSKSMSKLLTPWWFRLKTSRNSTRKTKVLHARAAGARCWSDHRDLWRHVPNGARTRSQTAANCASDHLARLRLQHNAFQFTMDTPEKRSLRPLLNRWSNAVAERP